MYITSHRNKILRLDQIPVLPPFFASPVSPPFHPQQVSSPRPTLYRPAGRDILAPNVGPEVRRFYEDTYSGDRRGNPLPLSLHGLASFEPTQFSLVGQDSRASPARVWLVSSP